MINFKIYTNMISSQIVMMRFVNKEIKKINYGNIKY